MIRLSVSIAVLLFALASIALAQSPGSVDTTRAAAADTTAAPADSVDEYAGLRIFGESGLYLYGIDDLNTELEHFGYPVLPEDFSVTSGAIFAQWPIGRWLPGVEGGLTTLRSDEVALNDSSGLRRLRSTLEVWSLGLGLGYRIVRGNFNLYPQIALRWNVVSVTLRQAADVATRTLRGTIDNDVVSTTSFGYNGYQLNIGIGADADISFLNSGRGRWMIVHMGLAVGMGIPLLKSSENVEGIEVTGIPQVAVPRFYIAYVAGYRFP